MARGQATGKIKIKNQLKRENDESNHIVSPFKMDYITRSAPQDRGCCVGVRRMRLRSKRAWLDLHWSKRAWWLSMWWSWGQQIIVTLRVRPRFNSRRHLLHHERCNGNVIDLRQSLHHFNASIALFVSVQIRHFIHITVDKFQNLDAIALPPPSNQLHICLTFCSIYSLSWLLDQLSNKQLKHPAK